MIVFAIILIVAAIAIPNLLRARIAANEASAVSSIRNAVQQLDDLAQKPTNPTAELITSGLAVIGSESPDIS